MMTGPLMPGGALIIDFGRDVDAAYGTCRSIWTGLFGLTERTTYQSKPYDLLGYDDLVDRLDYPRPTPDEAYHHIRQKYDEDMRKIEKRPFSCWHVLGMGVLLFMFCIAIVGLPANLLLTHAGPPDWQIQLGDAVASGSLWGAVFFLFHLTWLVWINVREKEPRELKVYEKIMKHLGRTTFHITPIAVLIVWLGA